MAGEPPPWHGLPAEEVEAQYNPRLAVVDYKTFLARRSDLNRIAQTGLRRFADLSYGPADRNTLDVYPASRPKAAVHVFLHGGFWRAQSKDDFALVATRLVPDGLTVVIPNYELCPYVSLGRTVDSALKAVLWVANRISEFGGDPERITLAGVSSGAHLCAAALATDWSQFGLGPNLVKGAVLVSGIFDPSPMLLTSISREIGLTPEMAREHNYEAKPPVANAPVRLIVGGRETRLWIEQSVRYARHLVRHGVPADVVVSPADHHYSILEQYLNAGSDVLRAVRSLQGATVPGSPEPTRSVPFR